MSSRKTYDTDIITLRRIFAVSPATNAPIPSGNILATTSHGEAAYVDPYSIPGISQLSTALLSLPSTISTSVAGIGGVSQLLAGSGISLSPTNGIGIVTLTATGGGGSVTTANLTSTVIGLGTAGYLSSAIGVAAIPGGLVSTANLADLVSTSYFTSQLASTIIGLGTAGYLSSAVAAIPGDLVSTSYLATQLGSTVIGLGTAGYLSTIPTSLQSLSISTGNIFTSSVMLIDTTVGFGYTGFANELIVSSGNLLLNNSFLSGGGGGGGAVSQLIGGTNITISPPGGTGVVTINGAAAPSLAGFVSTANLANLVSTSYFTSQLTSTVIGLGTLGYLSSAIGSAVIPGGLVSTANLANLVSTVNLAGLVSTANLSGLVSTANLANLVSTSYFTSQLTSTIIGLGTAGYLSTIPNSLQTRTISTGTVFTSSVMLIDTTIGFGYTGFVNQLIVSSGTLLLNNNSLSGGSGGGGAVSQILGGTNITISPPGGTGIVTINGASIPALEGLVSTANLAGLVSTSYLTNQLASTVIGLGTAGYISSAVATIPGGLVSTANLADLVSTANLADLVSTANLADLVSTNSSYFNSQITSTVIGLGTVGYLSSATGGGVIPGGLVSTANLADLVSTTYLLNGIEFSSLSNESARLNFSSIFVNNVPILFDQYGNLSLSFQTL
jgi:3-dehydroquinate dehydratase